MRTGKNTDNHWMDCVKMQRLKKIVSTTLRIEIILTVIKNVNYFLELFIKHFKGVVVNDNILLRAEDMSHTVVQYREKIPLSRKMSRKNYR